ncbi:MAG: SLBB domain-containing protein [Ignavibacteriaceae bacterium]
MISKRIFLSLLFTLTFAFSFIHSQSTQDYLDLARQSGLTDAQIKQKAEAMGYTVDDYAKLKQSQQQQTENLNELRVRAGIDTTVITPNGIDSTNIGSQNLKPALTYSVPAFVDQDPGLAVLPAYGYKIFNYSPTTFQPSVNIPVPVNYVIGPGDEVVISLWGETQLVQRLTVAQDGSIYIPDAGLVYVSGLTMSSLRTRLLSVLSKSYSSLDVSANSKSGAKTHLDVSTGKLRSVKVFVLGEVNKPGGYTLPALSSSFTALYYSGGPNLNGSLRNVQVIRGGKVISTIDIYDYLLKGDQSSDVRLEDEDVLFVPPVGERVAIMGHVFRPAIYELKKGEKLKDLLKYAGGVNFSTYFQNVHIERVIPFDQRKDYQNNVLSVDLTFKTIDEFKNSDYTLSDGDVINIRGINKLPQNKVTITGDVKNYGTYELTDGMTIRDLVIKADTLFPDAFLEKAVLIRTLPSEKKEIHSFNLKAALNGDSHNNLKLENRDNIIIYKEENFFPVNAVEISGQVKHPGYYTSLKNMTVSDLIILAGGLSDTATTKNIEIARMDTVNANIYNKKYIVNLPKDYWNTDPSQDFKLQDYDKVVIKSDPSKYFAPPVFVSGEVNSPGAYYTLYEGERLKNFIERAGGFKSAANKNGIFVVRKNPVFKLGTTSNFIKSLPDSIKNDFRGESIYNRQAFLDFYSNRIPVDWNAIQKDSSSSYNLVLQPKDSVVVEKKVNEIYVLGEVGLPSTVPYKEGEGLSYYINQAGGYTENASEGDDIIIQANGKKWEASGWFFVPNPEIEAGSTIIVPSEIDTPSTAGPIIRDIATILGTTLVLVVALVRLNK